MCKVKKKSVKLMIHGYEVAGQLINQIVEQCVLTHPVVYELNLWKVNKSEPQMWEIKCNSGCVSPAPPGMLANTLTSCQLMVHHCCDFCPLAYN